jgi:hypothetical protein
MKIIKKTKLTVIVLTVCLILIAAVTTYMFGGNMDEFKDRIPAVEKTQFIDHGKNWRNLRYGEIIPVYRKGAKLYMEVYNTVNSNELPEELWKKIDTTSLAKQYGAMTVIANGPRYWVVNEIEAGKMSKEGKVASFGGIEMTQRASLSSTIFNGSIGNKKYTENIVNRETTYHYWKGNMVYELTSPKGDVYRMQSYSQQIDPNLTIKDLETLGKRLSLPDGWSYKARILEEDSKLVIKGTAYIINDDFLNTYQKIPK